MNARVSLMLPLLLLATVGAAFAGPIQIGFGGGASVPVSHAKDSFKSGWHGSGILRLNAVVNDFKTQIIPVTFGIFLF